MSKRADLAGVARCSSGEKVFAADMGAVKRIGVERWLDQYEWPVHWERFARFSGTLYDEFDRAFASLDGEDRVTLVAGADFLSVIRDVLHADAVKAWAKERGMAIDCDASTRPSYEPNFAALSVPFRGGEAGTLAALGSKLRRGVRGWVENAPLGLGARIRGALGTTAVWSLGTMHGLKAKQIADEGRPVRTVYANAILDPALARAVPLQSDALEHAVDRYGAALQRILPETLGFGLTKPEFQVSALMQAWKSRLAALAGLIKEIQAEVRDVPEKIHLNEVWKPHHTVICLALREKGSQIFGYNHGHDPMHVVQRQHAYLGFPHLTHFVCETSEFVRAFDTYYSNSPIAKVFPVTVVSCRSDELADVFKASQEPETTKRPAVMVIGYPMVPWRSQSDVTCFFAFHLEAEIRILRLLRSWGLRTLYKAHPDRLGEISGIYENYADEVLLEPFESVVDRADIILFLTTITTTFCLSVCTRKPIVVLNNKGKVWNPALREMFEKRCRFVPSGLGDDNRIQFDQDALRAACTQAGALPDFEIVRRVFTP